MSRSAESSGVAAAPLTLFEPPRFAVALVSGLADAFAAFVISAAAAEARAAFSLADFLPAGAADLATATFRVGSREPLTELRGLLFPVSVTFSPVVLAIAYRLCFSAPLGNKR
ncbi:hypothetical protein [Trinickia fusca]|uniref:hypothetical protein n=1 Tax=Trinickia fusca TaxID=2419777 RepID=UPI001FE5F627|nr:hypothetical protein [Trinickia fusca]